MIIDKKANRLLIYFFYDKDGIVDDYVITVLKDITKNVNKAYFVSNGKLADGESKKLDNLVDEIIERKNVGLDVWAYKETLEHEGFDNLANYDEVIMMNHTIMGPVCSTSAMFEEMAKCDLDFWGLTKFYRVPFDPFGFLETGYLPEHLQSHFIVVRKSLLSSKDFKEYWDNMPMIRSYNESVGYHESQFTKHFNDLGYKSDAYVKVDHLKEYTTCPIIYMPVTIIKEYKCPYFKRRTFFTDNYEDVLQNTTGQVAYELMEYLKNETDYDTDMIIKNVLRCYNMYDIKNCLSLNYTLPSKTTINSSDSYKTKKIALVYHVYFPDLLEETYKYVGNMPECADIYITTDTQEKKELIEKRFEGNKFNKLEVILIENRGRDVSALLVATKSFIMSYDYVCFAHDKKVGQVKQKSVGAAFAYHCLENVLGSKEYVVNVLDLFENNPRLGMLTPPPPIHADYFMGLGTNWGPNYEITKLLADKIGLNVPISKDAPPITPIGTIFWFRPKGLKKLFDLDWKYSDFPREPVPSDGTILHAVEHVYGLVEQDAGYYEAWGMTDYYSAMYITNLNFYVRGYAKNSYDSHNLGYYHQVVKKERLILQTQDKILSVLGLASKVFPSDLVSSLNQKYMRIYYDEGQGFSEENTIHKKIVSNSEGFSINVSFEEPVSSVRLDPTEEKTVFLRDVKIILEYSNGLRKKVDLSKCIINAKQYGKNNYFFSDGDPQINIFTKNKNIIGLTISGFFDCNIDVEQFIKITEKFGGGKPNNPKSSLRQFLSRVKQRLKRILGR